MTQITASRQRAVCVRRTVSRKLRSLYTTCMACHG